MTVSGNNDATVAPQEMWQRRKQIRQVLEFSRHGCSDKIAWSRYSMIAYVSVSPLDNLLFGCATADTTVAYEKHKNQYNLYLTYLETVDGASWRLATPVGYAVGAVNAGVSASSEISSGSASNSGISATISATGSATTSASASASVALPQLAHIEWSITGQELACVDTRGGLYIYMTGVWRRPFNPDDSGLAGVAQPAENSKEKVSLLSSIHPHLSLVYADAPPLAGSGSVASGSGGAASGLASGLAGGLAGGAEDSFSRLAGFAWLGVDKQLLFTDPATRTELRHPRADVAALFPPHKPPQFTYTYKATTHKHEGARHPFPSKVACLGVRRNGAVALWYQAESGVGFHRTVASCGPDATFDGWISHAAFAFTSRRPVLMAAYHPLSHIISVYGIDIRWNGVAEAQSVAQACTKVQQDAAAAATARGSSAAQAAAYAAAAAQQFLAKNRPVGSQPPSMDVVRLAKIRLGLGGAVGGAVGGSDCNFRVAQILFVVPMPNSSRKEPQLFVLSHSDTHSSVARFRIRDTPVALHESLAHLGNSGGSAGSSGSENEDTVALVREGEVALSEALQRIVAVPTEPYVYFHYANGRVELRDRETLELLSGSSEYAEVSGSGTAGATNSFKTTDIPSAGDYNATVVSGTEPPETVTAPQFIRSLFDVGFEFPQPNPRLPTPLFSAVAPTQTYRAVLLLPGHLQLFPLRKRAVASGNPHSDIRAVASAVAQRFISACYANIQGEELAAFVHIEAARIAASGGSRDLFVSLVLQECHRAISFSLDAAREPIDRLVSSPPFQKLLGLQLALGTSAGFVRDASGRLAHVLLHLRLSCLCLLITYRAVFQGLGGAAGSAGAAALVRSLGIIQWVVDFCVLLHQQLTQIGVVLRHRGIAAAAPHVALPILLAKIPRVLLLYCLGMLGKLDGLLRGAAEAGGKTGSVAQAYGRFRAILSRAPVNVARFEQFVRNFDEFMKSFYQLQAQKTSDMPEETPLFVEQRLVWRGDIPSEYGDVAQRLSTGFGNLQHSGASASELFFYDVSWLGVDLSGAELMNSGNGNVAEVINVAELGEQLEAIGGAEKVAQLKWLQAQFPILDALRKQELPEGGVAQLEIVLEAVAQSSETELWQLLAAEAARPDVQNGAVALVAAKQREIGDVGGGAELIRNLRRCTRCGAVSAISEEEEERHTSGSSAGAIWTVPFTRTCFCGGNWGFFGVV